MKRQTLFRITAVGLSILVGLLIIYIALPALLRIRLTGASRQEMTDEERRLLAGRTEGAYALDEDPFVGIRMKGGLDKRRILDGDVRTDAYGMRLRPGPEPREGARRIVILGDSVAFGFGLEDDETLAHGLEVQLAAATPVGIPPPVVFTIACPGWTLRNSTRYLKSHLARIAPDVVLFIPVENDLHDGWTTDEVGHHSRLFDPASGATSVHVSLEDYWALLDTMSRRASRRHALALAMDGGMAAIPHAVVAGITPESRRRWAEAGNALDDLNARLQSRGASFAVLMLWQTEFERQLGLQLRDSGSPIPCISLFENPEAEDRLRNHPLDPHPNARTTSAAARAVAEVLLDRGWASGRKDALPELHPDYASRRAAPSSPEILRRWWNGAQEIRARHTGSQIDLETAVGFHQIYGGVRSDLSVGRGFSCGLRRGGQQMELVIDRIPPDRGLYPLQLEIAVNGALAARLPVPPPIDGDTVVHLAAILPEELRDQEFVDVVVTPSNWIADSYLGRSRMTSFYLRRIALK